jgi:hypothetical protein
MTRYLLVEKTILENPFYSTHFGWLDIGIEKQGFNNCIKLNECLNIFRDKVSACYIDYISKDCVQNLSEYFKWGRCAIASGFFTGHKDYLIKFCQLIIIKFLEYSHKGYGHADEQLFSPVVFENQEIFEFYFGDYKSIITNYEKVNEDIHSIIYFFIKNSFKNREYYLCYQACHAIWKYCFELNPTKDRKLSDPLNTTILGKHQHWFLAIYISLAIFFKDKLTYNICSEEVKNHANYPV